MLYFLGKVPQRGERLEQRHGQTRLFRWREEGRAETGKLTKPREVDPSNSLPLGWTRTDLPVSEAEDTAAILCVEPLASSSSPPLLLLLLGSTVDSFFSLRSESGGSGAACRKLAAQAFRSNPHSTAVQLAPSSAPLPPLPSTMNCPPHLCTVSSRYPRLPVPLLPSDSAEGSDREEQEPGSRIQPCCSSSKMPCHFFFGDKNGGSCSSHLVYHTAAAAAAAARHRMQTAVRRADRRMDRQREGGREGALCLQLDVFPSCGTNTKI